MLCDNLLQKFAMNLDLFIYFKIDVLFSINDLYTTFIKLKIKHLLLAKINLHFFILIKSNTNIKKFTITHTST